MANKLITVDWSPHDSMAYRVMPSKPSWLVNSNSSSIHNKLCSSAGFFIHMYCFWNKTIAVNYSFINILKSRNRTNFVLVNLEINPATYKLFLKIIIKSMDNNTIDSCVSFIPPNICRNAQKYSNINTGMAVTFEFPKNW